MHYQTLHNGIVDYRLQQEECSDCYDSHPLIIRLYGHVIHASVERTMTDAAARMTSLRSFVLRTIHKNPSQCTWAPLAFRSSSTNIPVQRACGPSKLVVFDDERRLGDQDLLHGCRLCRRPDHGRDCQAMPQGIPACLLAAQFACVCVCVCASSCSLIKGPSF
jgi:hypothetical protein